MKKILYFSSTWCQPCKMLGPIMESVSGQVNYQKVDVDNNQELSMKYSIRNIPTLVLVDSNGNELNRSTGVMQKQQIIDFYNG
jgi:thioredoxin 1